MIHKMNNYLKLFCILAFIQFSSIPLGEARLDDSVRDSFPLIVDQLCHASVKYKLDDRLETVEVTDVETGETETVLGAKDRYNKAMSCIFEQGVVKTYNSLNQDFEIKFLESLSQKQNFGKPLEVKTEGCEAMGSYFRKQTMTPTSNAYISECVVDERDSVVEKDYSICRITETVFNEFCAYQEFLEWKKDDDTILTEFNTDTVAEKYKLNDQPGKHKNKVVKILETERVLAKKVLEESLLRYQEFEQSYRMHLWNKLFFEGVEVLRLKLAKIRKAIYKFPAKFHNAAASSCK